MLRAIQRSCAGIPNATSRRRGAAARISTGGGPPPSGPGEPATVPAMASAGTRRASTSAARSATAGRAPRRKAGAPGGASRASTAGTRLRPGTRAGRGSPSSRDATSTQVPSATTRSASRAIVASSRSLRVSITNSGLAVMTKVRSPAACRRTIRSAAAVRSRRSNPTPRTSTRAATERSLVDGDEASAEELEVLERETGALGHAVERVLGHVAGHPGDLGEELVHVAQERAAPGKHHALVDNVGRELGRGLFEYGLHRADAQLEHGVHRLGDLVRADRDRAWETGDEVATADLHRELGIHGQSRADLDLDVFGGALADHEVVPLAHEVRDRFVQLVARGAHAARHHDPAERDDGDLRGAPADVDDEVAGRSGDRDVRADRRRERLLDSMFVA